MLKANNGEDLDGCRDDRLSDVIDPVFTTMTVSLCQLVLNDCFAVAFWFPSCESFLLSFWIARSGCVLKAVLVKSVCGLESQYFRRLL